MSGNHEKLNEVRHKLLAASYTSFSFGMNFELMFQKFDKDGNGTLDYEELRMLVRKILKVPPSTISDDELEALFGFLDFDGGGTIEQSEITSFLEKGEDEANGGHALVLPTHMQYMGPKRTPTEELCALINFKTEKEKKRERREPRPPPGEVPWNSSVKSKRTIKPFAGIGVQFYVPNQK